jgi:hypothetical protein
MTLRPFRVGDRVCDNQETDRIGTVIKEWPRKRDMWVRFDYQPSDEYTIVSKNYMEFSGHPLDRLVMGV